MLLTTSRIIELKMKVDKKLRDQIFEIVDNQIKANKPPETGLTYKRLIGFKYNDFQAKQMIGQCITVEIFEIGKNGKPFDGQRYITSKLMSV